MDPESKNNVMINVNNTCDEDGWTIVSSTQNEWLPTLPESPEFELVSDKNLRPCWKKPIGKKRKKSKKKIAKSYTVIIKEEVPCEDWHSCEKCFSALIDDIPYIDEGEEEPYGYSPEGATALSQRVNPHTDISNSEKRTKLKRSAAMYQIHEADEDKENAHETFSSECEVVSNEYTCETARSEKERKLQDDIEENYNYDFWDSNPKKGDKRRKSSPIPRERVKESKFWGAFGDWKSMKRRLNYS